MPFARLSRRILRPALYALLAVGALAAPTTASGFVTAVPALGFAPALPPAAVGEPARLHVAQSREAAELQLQLQQLQEQIRVLTGQVEGLQFQLTQMQTLIERMGEDNEFRFQQLEGGAGGKPDAATQSGGVTQPGVLPQDPASPASPASPADPAAIPDAGGGEPMHDLGDSADPLLGTGEPGAAPLGTLPEDDPTAGGTQPLDLSLGEAAEVSNGDAKAQYAAGYEAMVRGDYAFAEDQFEQFVALYPDDPQAADATNWLGEALIQRGAFDDAALVLAEGYQKYVDSPRAPELMLRLGVALSGAGERDVACRTFATLAERYPEMTPALRQSLDAERNRAQCPPA